METEELEQKITKFTKDPKWSSIELIDRALSTQRSGINPAFEGIADSIFNSRSLLTRLLREQDLSSLDAELLSNIVKNAIALDEAFSDMHKNSDKARDYKIISLVGVIEQLVAALPLK